jgi:hypothetical protein
MLIFIAETLGTGLPLALPRPRAIAKKLAILAIITTIYQQVR